MSTDILQVHRLSKQYTRGHMTTKILDDINITFELGSTYAITGVSGSGKSTFMHLLAGLDTPTMGYVTYNGVSLTDLSEDACSHFLNRSIGLLFQNPCLIHELSVIENVILPALIAKIPYKQAYAHAQQLLEQVGLLDKENMMPGMLSGGQQQRVALARALCNKPAFLLADEPTGSLDEHTAATITALLITCQRTWNMGLVISTHDTHVAQAMHHVYVLHDGTLTIHHQNKHASIS
jgi:lipoprotein-releasing system ATP-binding protein